jgi:hypothetical protein
MGGETFAGLAADDGALKPGGAEGGTLGFDGKFWLPKVSNIDEVIKPPGSKVEKEESANQPD